MILSLRPKPQLLHIGARVLLFLASKRQANSKELGEWGDRFRLRFQNSLKPKMSLKLVQLKVTIPRNGIFEFLNRTAGFLT